MFFCIFFLLVNYMVVFLSLVSWYVCSTKPQMSVGIITDFVSLEEWTTLCSLVLSMLSWIRLCLVLFSFVGFFWLWCPRSTVPLLPPTTIYLMCVVIRGSGRLVFALDFQNRMCGGFIQQFYLTYSTSVVLHHPHYILAWALYICLDVDVLLTFSCSSNDNWN